VSDAIGPTLSRTGIRVILRTPCEHLAKIMSIIFFDKVLTCEEEEKLHLGERLAKTLPLPDREWDKMVVFSQRAGRVKKSLRPELVAVHPVVSLHQQIQH
jgi:hypothetical protein